MTTVATHQQIIPHKAFVGVALALASTVVLMTATKHFGVSTPDAAQSTSPDATLTLRVDDAPQGSVIVRNAETGGTIKEFKRAEGSFLRAALRALVNDRRHKGATLQGDFLLERHSGGQLYLIDGVTGKKLSLNAYGPDNAAVFAAFMSNPKKGEGQ
jgi:putative photosynthetic complex assembly protein